MNSSNDTIFCISRILLPILICSIIFGNHYARDAVGALEKQLEMDAFISTKLYANLNTLYFFPNTITPLLAGISVNAIGGPSKCLLYSVTIASLGHILFSLGINLIINKAVNRTVCIYIILFGRCLAGTMYEVIDTIPIMILGPLYEKEWGVLVGVMNGFLRMGSVLNFILCPILYQSYGIHVAFWVSTGIACFGSLCAFISIYLERNILLHTNIIKVIPDENNSRTINISNETTFDKIKNLLPLHLFSKQFYFWTIGGGALYGAMVPFWFIGSKYLQNYYNMSVRPADTLMLIPEGLIVIFSVPIGICIDKYKYSIRNKLLILSFSVIMLPISYFMLIYGSHHNQSNKLQNDYQNITQSNLYNNQENNSIDTLHHTNLTIYISPYIPMFLLGIGYAFSNCFFWNILIPIVNNKDHMSSASGLVASVMNILPTIIPIAVSSFISGDASKNYLFVLSITGIISSCFFLLAAIYANIQVDEPIQNSPNNKRNKIRNFLTNRINKITGSFRNYTTKRDNNIAYEMISVNDVNNKNIDNTIEDISIDENDEEIMVL